jgi:hypothetical protein
MNQWMNSPYYYFFLSEAEFGADGISIKAQDTSYKSQNKRAGRNPRPKILISSQSRNQLPIKQWLEISCWWLVK